LRGDLLAKADGLAKLLNDERRAHAHERKVFNAQWQAAHKLHLQELALANSKIARLEKQVDLLTQTLNVKQQGDAVREDVKNGLTLLREDLAKRKLQ